MVLGTVRFIWWLGRKKDKFVMSCPTLHRIFDQHGRLNYNGPRTICRILDDIDHVRGDEIFFSNRERAGLMVDSTLNHVKSLSRVQDPVGKRIPPGAISSRELSGTVRGSLYVCPKSKALMQWPSIIHVAAQDSSLYPGCLLCIHLHVARGLRKPPLVICRNRSETRICN